MTRHFIGKLNHIQARNKQLVVSFNVKHNVLKF